MVASIDKPLGKGSGVPVWDKRTAPKPPASGQSSFNDQGDEGRKGGKSCGGVFVKSATVATAVTEAHGAIAADVDGLQQQSADVQEQSHQQSTSAQQQPTAVQQQPTAVQRQPTDVQQQSNDVQDALGCAGMVKRLSLIHI